ncbi:MAG: DNA repair protein RecO [Clostridia bacterium]|nr:DNA repair protein RecO [Clostridia bacterium]
MEKNLKTDGLIIRTSDYKENDKMVTILSKEFGRIDVIMRGCRKQGAKLFGASSLFCYGDFLLYNNNERLSVNSCDIKHSFYDLSSDVEKMAVATFICEVAGGIASPMERHGALFALVINLLVFLENGTLSSKQVLFCFAVKICDIFGVRPVLSECCLCGEGGFIGGFSIANGGLVCKECSKATKVNPIKREHLAAINEVLAHKNSELAELCAIDDYAMRLMLKYMMVNLSINDKRMEFLRKIGLIR